MAKSTIRNNSLFIIGFLVVVLVGVLFLQGVQFKKTTQPRRRHSQQPQCCPSKKTVKTVSGVKKALLASSQFGSVETPPPSLSQLNPHVEKVEVVPPQGQDLSTIVKEDKTPIPDPDNPEIQKCRVGPRSAWQCYVDRCDTCPMSSYKQCTNNNPYQMFPPQTPCPCTQGACDTCPCRLSQKCLLQKGLCNHCQQSALDQGDEPQDFPRVNYWKTPPTDSILDLGI